MAAQSPAPFYEWGPYLAYGQDPSRAMTVSWESERFALDAWVKYGETPDCSHTVKWESATPKRHQTFLLDNLNPETTYYYRISRDNGQTVHQFTTGIPAGVVKPFEFCVLGDMHTDHGDVTPTLRALDTFAPKKSFVVSVGDAINAGEKESSWQDFFRQVTPFAHNLPWVHATGNHDTGNRGKYGRFLATFDQPYPNPRNGAYFSFDFSNAHFIIIDSCNGGTFEPTPNDDQMGWLEADLSANARKDKWVFAFFHNQVYSTGDFSMSPLMHQWLRPLFDEHQVDIVFYGHDHHFELFHCGASEAWGGTYYVVTGGGSVYSTLDWSIMNPRKKRGEVETGPHHLWLRDVHVAQRDFFHGGDTANKYGARMDDLVQKCQVYGALRQHFTKMALDGDTCRLQAVDPLGEVFFEKRFTQKQKK